MEELLFAQVRFPLAWLLEGGGTGALGVCAFPTGRGAVGYLLLMPIRAAQCLLSERFIAIG